MALQRGRLRRRVAVPDVLARAAQALERRSGNRVTHTHAERHEHVRGANLAASATSVHLSCTSTSRSEPVTNRPRPHITSSRLVPETGVEPVPSCEEGVEDFESASVERGPVRLACSSRVRSYARSIEFARIRQVPASPVQDLCRSTSASVTMATRPARRPGLHGRCTVVRFQGNAPGPRLRALRCPSLDRACGLRWSYRGRTMGSCRLS